MKPIMNQILFKPFVTDEVSDAGLLIPETARRYLDRGTIVAVGRGTSKRPMNLKEGMVGYRVHDWGEMIIQDGETYFLMDEAAILAVE